MMKFKRIFYIICSFPVLIVSFIYLFQNDILFETDSMLYMGRIGMAKFLIKLGGVTLVLFIVELIIENIHISSLNRSITNLEKEKLELKAKLYDESELLTATNSATPKSEIESEIEAIEKKEPEQD
jgi:uncharacterized membrane protein affecting hemolysin expression